MAQPVLKRGISAKKIFKAGAGSYLLLSSVDTGRAESEATSFGDGGEVREGMNVEDILKT